MKNLEPKLILVKIRQIIVKCFSDFSVKKRKQSFCDGKTKYAPIPK